MNTFVAAFLMSLIPLAVLFSFMAIAITIVRLTQEGLIRFKTRQLYSRKLMQYQQFGKNLRKGIDRRKPSDRRLSKNDRREPVSGFAWATE